MPQLIAVFLAIIVIFAIIFNDKEGVDKINDPYRNQTEHYSKYDYERNRVITFDIHKIKGNLLNIDRRSFREGLRKALENSSKIKIGYNPNIKMVILLREKNVYIDKYVQRKNGRRYYVVKKSVTVVAEYALIKNRNKTYFIDSLEYSANIKAGSYSNYDDALYKIDKRLYWIVARKVANRLVERYKTIVRRIYY